MTAFRDFLAIEYGRPEGIDSALVAANDWLMQTGTSPLSVETIKNITGGGLAAFTSSDAGLRVWYVVSPTSAADQ